MYKVYASDKPARINLGIRRRLAPLMENDRSKIELLNVLLLSLPGTPVLYYGDEIGMGDNYYLGDRDGVRTPMQWNNDENAGFSEANPHSLYLPVIRDTEYSYRWLNVKRQEQNPNSLLNWTRKILAKRREFSVFGRGTIKWLSPENGRILSFVREYEGERILVVVNLSRHPQSVQLDLAEYQGLRLREVFGKTFFNDIGREPYQLTIASHGYYWLQIETSGAATKDVRELKAPLLRLNDFKELFGRSQQKNLRTKILPNYLRSVSWMGPKGQQLESVEILEERMHSNERRHFGWLLCRVNYHEQQPELIQLPLAIHNFRPEINYADTDAAICKISRNDTDKEYVLMDALYDEEYRMALLNGFAEFGEPKNYVFNPSEELKAAKGQDVLIDHSGPEYMILQSRDITLKYYRKVDVSEIPDLEVKKALSAHKFEASPNILGTLIFKLDQTYQTTIATYEERENTSGLAWDLVTNQFQRFAEEVLARYRQNDTEHALTVSKVNIEITDSITYKDMPELVQEILGAAFVQRIAELGRATAEYHRHLSQVKAPTFKTEALSLHYQRSLYAGHKAQMRTTFTLLDKKMSELSDADQELAKELRSHEEKLHVLLKRVYRHKIEADKIRIHGDYTLEQVYLKDEGFLIRNFDGDPDQAFSQRRLRRSPAKDLANMLRSFNYAALLAQQEQGTLADDTRTYLNDWLDLASQCLSAEFLTAYRKATVGTRLLPADDHDYAVMLDTFMIEKSLQEMRYDLDYRPAQAGVPMQGLLSILRRK
jgi:maltose alpha-D-glucosyltransferase/alpha-amylase